jgi:hypothetical protein
MAINNYDGFLKYKQDNGDIAVLYPKTKVANVEGAATAASVTALSGRVDIIDTNVTANTTAITKEVSDREAADTALDTRVQTLETGAHNPPQLYISDTEPEAIKARDWWFDTSAT